MSLYGNKNYWFSLVKYTLSKLKKIKFISETYFKEKIMAYLTSKRKPKGQKSIETDLYIIL